MQQSNDEKIERWKRLYEQAKHTEELSWTVFQIFLLPHVIFLGFLLSVGFGKEEFIGWNPGIFIAAIVGVVLCVVWVILNIRLTIAKDCDCALAQAAEEVLDTGLTEQRQQMLRNKSVVKVGRYCFRIDWFRKFRIRYSFAILILVFIITYLSITILRGPWMG